MPYNREGILISDGERDSLITQAMMQQMQAYSDHAKSLAFNPIVPLLNQGEIFGPKKTVLIKRNAGMGDVLCVTPTLRHLSKQGITVDVETEGHYACLFEGNPYIRRVNQSDVEKAYDATADLSGYVERYDNLIQHRPYAFAASIGLEITDFELDYQVSHDEAKWARRELDRQPYCKRPVGYVYRTTTHNRNWVDRTHEQMLEKIIRAGFPVVVFGAHKERMPYRSPKIFNTTGKYGIRETAAIMNQCFAVISPDTGLFHLASALRKPILAYFGAFPLEERISHKNVTLVNHNQCDYAPCHAYNCYVRDRESPCLKTNPDRVIERLREIQSVTAP